jgi:RimJ/RimL family protein N-acetyltransferase
VAKVLQTLETMYYMTFQLYSLETSRLLIRQLSDQDIIDDYLSWMQNEENSFIKGVDPNITKKDLYSYINEKNYNSNSVLLGIFDKETKKHIGNIKFEPINLVENYAVLGIFIGDADYRGLGLAQEAIEHTFQSILMPKGVNKLVLGVDKLNEAAIATYKKSGFKLAKIPLLNLPTNSQEMILQIDLHSI